MNIQQCINNPVWYDFYTDSELLKELRKTADNFQYFKSEEYRWVWNMAALNKFLDLHAIARERGIDAKLRIAEKSENDRVRFAIV